MTDLATLAAELLPGAALADRLEPSQGRTAGDGRAIAWVRVLRARVPAFDALDAGDLVIAPAAALAVVAPGLLELRDLARALAAVPVSGVILVEGDSPMAAAPADAFAEAGLATLSVPRTDPAALERSLVGYIVARGAELERQAALLEGELRRRALEGGGVAALVAIVSSFLGRSIALEADRGEPVVIHAPVEVPAAAADAARYQARSRDRGAVALRVVLPSASGAAGSLVLVRSEERRVGKECRL